MAITGFNSFFSLLSLTIFTLTISHIQISEGINNPICKATHNVSLCENIVGNARNAREATLKAVYKAATTNRYNQEKLTPVIEEAAAAAKLPPAEKDALVKLCADNFGLTGVHLNTSTIFIGRGDPSAASSFLRGALNATNDCRDAVTQKLGAILAFDNAINLFDDVMDVTISLAHQIK